MASINSFAMGDDVVGHANTAVVAVRHHTIHPQDRVKNAMPELGCIESRGVARIWRLRRHGVLCAREACGEKFLS